MATTIKFLKTSFKAIILFTILTGLFYPVVVTVFAYLFFPNDAAGRIIKKGYANIGSELVGQNFTTPKYLQGRPSATNYATMPSGASNLSPTSGHLKDEVEARRRILGDNAPADLLTTSASGLDPHISPEAARFQIKRIAAARSLDAADTARIDALITEQIESPLFGFLGKSRVNVLEVNLQLDQEFGTK
jgi:K+-transporting ATPase ATPase C chain